MLNEKLISRQTFDLQSDRLLLKEVIKREFLAIEIWAINDDNPNNNYSHFVSDDYARSLPSFVYKPILGYFSQGDFKAHEGKNTHDTEMDVNYWDNSKGEQILGVIRNKDKIEIREKDGKKWIVVSAVLWSNYNYHQIKKIIKDKRKKVSVEINVEDAYFTDLNGNMLNAIELKNDKTLIVKDENDKEIKYKRGTYIEHITQFDLSGITILGSKMGIPIKEGIEGASLSILDEMDKALFSRQQQALSFAYQKLDGKDESVDADIFSKEDKGNMDNQDLNVEVQTPANTETFEGKPEEEKGKAILDESGNELKMEEKHEGEPKQENHEQENSDADGHSENCADDNCKMDAEGGEENCKNCKMDAEENGDDKGDDDDDKDGCDCGEDNCKNAAEDGADCEDNCKACKNAEEGASEPAKEENQDNCKFEAEGAIDDHSADGQGGNSEEDYAALLSKYNEVSAALEECQQALAAQEKMNVEKDEELQAARKQCDEYLEVKEKYEAENEELRKAIFTMISEKRCEQAKELMSQNGLSNEQRTDFLNRCQNGDYNESYDELKRDIAVAYFDVNCGTNVKRNSDEDFSVTLAPKATSIVNKAKTSKEKMKEYAQGK